MVAVTGDKGSGKSTLLRILAGVLKPTKGVVSLEVNGEQIAAEDFVYHAGLVAPYLDVYEGFSARENLAFIAKVRGMGDASARIAAVLDEVGLGKRGKDLVRTYSSGMKQRVKFAAALLTDPPLLLLDEPSSNLDEAGLAMVDAIINKQRESGRLLIVATNDAREASQADQRVHILDYR